MKITKNLSALILFLLITSSTCLFAQDGQQQKMSPEQKAWMDYMTPGPMQKMLEKSVGKWKTISKFWQYPGAEPMISEGFVENEMILGGRYLKSTHHGTVMNMPFEGMSLDAYDKAIGKFKNVWIDNMGTGISTSVGTYDETTKTINYNGTMVDPVQKKNISFRSVAKFIDENTQIFQMYMLHEGKEFKGMEVKSTRVK